MLTIKQLSVAVDAQPIITNLNLHIAVGTVHLLRGPNGSGKSSLLCTLMGHPRYTITHGSIEYKGGDLAAMVVHERARAGLFLAVQQPIIIPGVTVFSLLKESYMAITGAPISVADFTRHLYEAMDIVGLSYSHAYRTFNEGFSGGERKRLELLQMLLLKPKLLLLDEIDSGVDMQGQQIIVQTIARMRAAQPESSFLIITHAPALAEQYQPDAIHQMIDGTLVASSLATNQVQRDSIL